MKTRALHAIVWKEKNLFVARLLEIELASQGKTKEEALKNVKEALDLYLKDEDTRNLSITTVENVSTQTVPFN